MVQLPTTCSPLIQTNLQVKENYLMCYSVSKAIKISPSSVRAQQTTIWCLKLCRLFSQGKTFIYRWHHETYGFDLNWQEQHCDCVSLESQVEEEAHLHSHKQWKQCPKWATSNFEDSEYVSGCAYIVCPKNIGQWYLHAVTNRRGLCKQETTKYSCVLSLLFIIHPRDFSWVNYCSLTLKQSLFLTLEDFNRDFSLNRVGFVRTMLRVTPTTPGCRSWCDRTRSRAGFGVHLWNPFVSISFSLSPGSVDQKPPDVLSDL